MLPSEIENRFIDIALLHWDRLRLSIICAKAFHDATDPLTQANLDSVVEQRENISESLVALSEGTCQMSFEDGNSGLN